MFNSIQLDVESNVAQTKPNKTTRKFRHFLRSAMEFFGLQTMNKRSEK